MDWTGAENSMHRLMLCRAVLSALALLAAPTSHGQELPPEIQVDRLWVQAEREAAEGNPWSAAYTLEQALQLYEAHGIEILAEFWIRYAQALQAAGLHEAAVEALTRYLQEAGREGDHYQTALRLLDEADNDLAAARREEARRRAEAQRAAEEAAAREAPVLEAVIANLPEMVAIPAGSYRMGCVSGRNCETEERPVHEVRVTTTTAGRMTRRGAGTGSTTALTSISVARFPECKPMSFSSHPTAESSWMRSSIARH